MIGTYIMEAPSVQSYTAAATFDRAAGNYSGNYSLTVGSGPAVSGTWTIWNGSGSASFNRSAGTVAISISINGGSTGTGNTSFTLQGDDQITLSPFAITGGGDNLQTAGYTVLSRVGNKYVGAVNFLDGLPASPWADFTSWVVQITDTTGPSVVITSPASSPMQITNASTVEVSGTADDDLNVKQVTWANNRGGSGVASGKTSWSASMPLASGTNLISIQAFDAAGNSGSGAIAVVLDLVPVTRPTLQVSKVGTSMVFKWPADATGFQLQWADTPQQLNWNDEVSSPTILAGYYTVTTGLSSGARFYRLKK